jgi:hypothetical protein
MFYVPRAEIQWKAVLKTFGAASSIHRHFRFWGGQGFFQDLWIAGLESYDEARGVGWMRLSADDCVSEASFGTRSGGGKPQRPGSSGGWARSPPVLVATGDKSHDVSQLETVLDSFQSERPDSFETPRRVCLNKGYNEGGLWKLLLYAGSSLYQRPGAGKKRKAAPP